MALTYYNKQSSICKDCYKILMYSEYSDAPDELYLDIGYDSLGNMTGLTDQDRNRIMSQPDGVYFSLESMRTAETAYPEDLLRLNNEYLPNADIVSTDSLSSAVAMNAYYANVRIPKAIKARDNAGNYFIKIIKPPLVSAIELYARTGNVARPTEVILSFSYKTDETGYFHPTVIRIDQTDTDSGPAEIKFHADMVHAHAEQKKHIPMNIEDDDLVEADYYQQGIFSCIGNTSSDTASHAYMDATVVNGNLLTRGFQLAYLGPLFRDSNTHVEDKAPEDLIHG